MTEINTINIADSDTKVYENIRTLLANARTQTIRSINNVLVMTYWEIGRQISEAIGDRADYGKQLLIFLAERLTEEFGQGFFERNLRRMR